MDNYFINKYIYNNVQVAGNATSTSVAIYNLKCRILIKSSGATSLTVQHSLDNVNWYDGETIAVTAGTKSQILECCQFVRVVNTTAATLTIEFI